MSVCDALQLITESAHGNTHAVVLLHIGERSAVVGRTATSEFKGVLLWSLVFHQIKRVHIHQLGISLISH